MGRLFGTDGARGIANTELTAEIAMNIGRAAALVLSKHTFSHPRVLIGMDTRISGDMLKAAVCAGLCSVGADAVVVGVLPTPATAYLISKCGCDAGVMISASHNPCEYNGIKLFDKDGYKLPDALEEEIERLVLDTPELLPSPTHGELGRIIEDNNAVKLYIEHIKSTIDVDLSGMKIAFDCANGSSSVTAYDIFSSLGANCLMLSHEPDGININYNCGSTHMDNLITYVKENGCDAGFAFDGDADRCLAVDENGELIDGDRLIAIAASDMKSQGRLNNNTAVMTVMSNIGFFKFAEKNGIHVTATKVGDRYVLEEMKRSGCNIGGENSGHIIFLDYASTGDGQLSALQILGIMKRSGRTLSQLASCMEVYPQILVNIKTTNEVRNTYAESKDVADAIADVEKKLGTNGRVLVRASGTEPLVRVMLEGKDIGEITELAEYIADKIRNL